MFLLSEVVFEPSIACQFLKYVQWGVKVDIGPILNETRAELRRSSAKPELLAS